MNNMRRINMLLCSVLLASCNVTAQVGLLSSSVDGSVERRDVSCASLHSSRLSLCRPWNGVSSRWMLRARLHVNSTPVSCNSRPHHYITTSVSHQFWPASTTAQRVLVRDSVILTQGAPILFEKSPTDIYVTWAQNPLIHTYMCYKSNLLCLIFYSYVGTNHN